MADAFAEVFGSHWAAMVAYVLLHGHLLVVGAAVTRLRARVAELEKGPPPPPPPSPL